MLLSYDLSKSTFLHGLFFPLLFLNLPLFFWHDYYGQEMKKRNTNTTASTDHNNNAKPLTGTNSPKANTEQPQDKERQLPECSQNVPQDQSPSTLPRDFSDDSGKIRTRSGTNLV